MVQWTIFSAERPGTLAGAGWWGEERYECAAYGLLIVTD
jgi:hypothetical protein